MIRRLDQRERLRPSRTEPFVVERGAQAVALAFPGVAVHRLQV